MPDLTNSKLMWLKAGLFLGIGFLATVLLGLDMPRSRDVIYFVLAVWAFCRAYYFAFYVIQHYIDPHYKFSGLISFFRYLFKKGE